MKFTAAKKEFDLRYYLWATSEFEREIEESFPTLRLFKAGSTWKTYQFMQQLAKSGQLNLAHSLLKRFHAEAVQALGESCSTEEELLRSRCDGFRLIPAGLDAEIEARRMAGEKIRFASKRKLRKVMTAQFKAAFGDECIGLACVDEEPDLRFKMRRSGWTVNTRFDFGRSETLLNYRQNVVSDQTIKYQGKEVAMVMGFLLSFNSKLGISSQTEWPYLMDEDIEPTCNAAIKLCGDFFEVAPKLLKGLEADKVTPDEE